MVALWKLRSESYVCGIKRALNLQLLKRGTCVLSARRSLKASTLSRPPETSCYLTPGVNKKKFHPLHTAPVCLHSNDGDISLSYTSHSAAWLPSTKWTFVLYGTHLFIVGAFIYSQSLFNFSPRGAFLGKILLSAWILWSKAAYIYEFTRHKKTIPWLGLLTCRLLFVNNLQALNYFASNIF